MLIRSLGFSTLFLLSLMVPLLPFLFFSFLYVLFFSGYEILLIAFFIDATFGGETASYLYTVTTGLLLAVSIILKPYFSWHKEISS